MLYLTTDPGIPVLGHKGASVHVREMAGALHAAGAEVVVVSSRVHDAGASFEAGVALCAIPPVLPRECPQAALRAAIADQRDAVLELCRRLRPDIVYERFALFSDAGVHAARMCGIPHVLEVNSPLRAEAERWRVLPHEPIAVEMEQDVCRATDRILCVSDGVASAVAEWAGPTKIEVLPNAIARRLFCHPAALADHETPTIGFAGSLKPWHGIDTMLRALVAVLEACPDVQCEIVGDGPMLGVVRDSALDPKRLTVHGAVDHATAVALMQTWDVGLAPYAYQPGFYFSPLKVLEYMAAGICAVASDQGQIRSLLGDGARGVLVEPDDHHALAAALIDLLGDRPRIAALAVKARAYVLANHTWERNAARVLDIAAFLRSRAA